MLRAYVVSPRVSVEVIENEKERVAGCLKYPRARARPEFAASSSQDRTV